MSAKRSVTFVWTSLLLVLFLAPCAAGAPENATLPADDAWTESLDFLTPDGRRGWGWRWHHEDKDKSLCKPVKGKTLLLDEKNKTTGKASIHFHYNSAEALKIRTDIPEPTPRQIYNMFYLPDPPTDATGYDAIEFDLRCVPEGAVTAVRVIVNQRLGSNRRISCTGRNTPFLGGEKWRRFGVYLKDLASVERPSLKKLEKGEWTKCDQIVIDVKLSIEALKKSEYVDVWVDGLRFVRGKSEAADKTAAAPPKPAPKSKPVGAFGKLPAIEWEDLGVMVAGRTTLRGSPGLGFSTDKDGWSAYAGYRDHIVKRKPYVICEINLQTGKVKRFPAPPEEKTDAWAFKVFPDGRPYTMPGGGSKTGARIARVDWKTGKIQVFGPCPDAWNYCWRWGAADDAIYIGGYRKGYAIRFDPETGEITDYGRQAMPHGGAALTIAADDKYVYTTVGKNTSYLVACDRKTKEQRILRQAQYPKSWTLNSYDGQVFARLHPPTYKNGVRKWQEFRVRHAELEPIPARPARKGPSGPREAFGVPRPELLRHSALCEGDGYATLWYRRANEEWKSIRYKVDDIPSYLYRLGMTPDGKIIGSSEDPYTIFTYDPRTGKKQILGPPPNKTHVYSFLPHPNGKTYMCGYSGAPLFEWDPAKPWNYQPAAPGKPMLNWKDPRINPLQVARMYRQRRAFTVLLAADGLLYIPCSAYVETFPGGCLGWYDPAKNEHGLIREGFETWRGRDACTADSGRYVVVTTVPWPFSQPEDKKTFELTDPYDLVGVRDGLKIRYQGTHSATGTRLTTEKELKALLGDRKKREVKYDTRNYVVTYDTKTKTVVGRLPIGVNPKSSDGVHGKVCEWKPGMVVVQAAADAQGRTRYGLLDVRTQKFEFKLTLPLSDYRSKLIRLPDGRIAAMHQNAVIFINPADWSWKAVGKLRPRVKGKEFTPRDWMVVGGDLYMYCDTQLARIKNIAAIDRK